MEENIFNNGQREKLHGISGTFKVRKCYLQGAGALGILYRPHYRRHNLFLNIHPVVVIVGLIFGTGKLCVVRRSSRSGLSRMRLWWLTWVGTLSLSGIGHLASDVAEIGRAHV